MTYRTFAAAISAVILTAGGVAAQNFNLPPTFGEVNLEAGFVPDPHSVPIVAGGDIDANDALGVDARGNACLGDIADAPDYRLQYSAGAFPLIFTVTSSGDTTLVVNAPDGSWYCDDDGAGYPNPMIEFAAPLSGQYDIWVGAYAGGNPEATLHITELTDVTDVAPIEPAAMLPDHTLAPTFGQIDLSTGFAPSPHSVDLVAGGEVAAYLVQDGCWGSIAVAPDYRLNFESGTAPLLISATSEADTTLVIRDPNGNWICDDDSGGSLNPLVEIAAPLSGQYDIWLGTFGGTADATLSIAEAGDAPGAKGPPPAEVPAAPAAEPAPPPPTPGKPAAALDDAAVDDALRAVIVDVVAEELDGDTAAVRAAAVECLFAAVADLPLVERQMLVDEQFDPSGEQIARLEQIKPGITDLVEACGL